MVAQQKRFRVVKSKEPPPEVFCADCGSLTMGGFICALCEFKYAAKSAGFKPSIKVVRR